MGTVVAARRNYGGPAAGRVNAFRWHREHTTTTSPMVCKFWLSGRCTRNPCRFLHPEVGNILNTAQRIAHQEHKKLTQRSNTVKKDNISVSDQKVTSVHLEQQEEQKNLKESTDVVEKEIGVCVSPVDHSGTRAEEQEVCSKNVKTHVEQVVAEENKSLQSNPTDTHDQNTQQKICKYWVEGHCLYGDKCKNLHSWSCGEDLTLLAYLDGHEKAITGVTLPKGDNNSRLFSASKDGTVRVWDCHTGQCTKVVDVGAPVECMTSQGLWVFAGLTNAVKIWNLQKEKEYSLNAPGGQVYAIFGDDRDGVLRVYAGVGDGSVLVWTFNDATGSFEETALLKGHSGAVISLHYCRDHLYSGSTDNTIRRWELKTLECVHVAEKHSDAVMSMLNWSDYLISSSLDKTLKVWGASSTEDNALEDYYTRSYEHGLLALCGMNSSVIHDGILLCSCNDNSTRLYEVPSLTERGRVFTREEVRKIEVGPDGLFFTGDATGRVSVWRFSPKTSTEAEDSTS